jgi:hypothetical protein
MKRILIILPLSFLLVFGGGFFVLADTNASGPLHSWYNKQFSEHAQGPISLGKSVSFMDGLKRNAASLFTKAKNDLAGFQSLSFLSVKSNINKQNQDLIAQVNSATDTLGKQEASNHASYQEAKKQQEADQVTKDAGDILNSVLNENQN